MSLRNVCIFQAKQQNANDWVSPVTVKLSLTLLELETAGIRPSPSGRFAIVIGLSDSYGPISSHCNCPRTWEELITPQLTTLRKNFEEASILLPISRFALRLQAS